jgi:P-type Cu2+ transporter
VKTSIIEVSGMLSVLSARGVEKQVARLPGVTRVEVNYPAGSATVVYDDTRVDLKTIKALVRDCGYHCSGELVPRHVCAPEDAPAVAAASAPMAGHAAHEAAAHYGASEVRDAWRRDGHHGPRDGARRRHGHAGHGA